ncbi:hypothetical protein [Paenibacillus sp. 1001270B_150601_E10]|nr:hypothetical protein [Paenibacillus sp. 1001270B_150601_E10]
MRHSLKASVESIDHDVAFLGSSNTNLVTSPPSRVLFVLEAEYPAM